ncbi:MAG TPA: S8 family serine peptidase [Blastocatellia bacterium]|nr:S8 family serine peptidase [Blastocatellia bacterium]HMX24129.1 S8 family serine peptidase [Blastocatellia bacterium]HMZ21271.1 S8 family serine peptidase [Blastocatellia bacterium]HNG30764.1 S8 family serine peptidase [Blastocatellia bacterium]
MPTPLRLGADERFAGRGTTIAFLDSGFYPHPDLTQPQNRVRCYVDTGTGQTSEEDYRRPDVISWHGTMTSVIAAGNGYLSGGRYRGIASEAQVVLVKVYGEMGLHHDDIRRGLEWVIEHREQYGIRIVNISCGGDHEASYLTDELCRRAEDAVRAGLILVCASGNDGHHPNHPVFPPASTPAVITVGGVNDKNNLYLQDSEMYRSSYGPTVDGLQKPEIVAPSILLAAPILPETATAVEAELLARLKVTPNDRLHAMLAECAGVSAKLDAACEQSPEQLRQLVENKIAGENIISHSYKHVDGTSFAAPIVSSIIAQMLEANPSLSPQQVKRILIDTAIRLNEVPIDQQGWGVVIPGKAVERALEWRA